MFLTTNLHWCADVFENRFLNDFCCRKSHGWLEFQYSTCRRPFWFRTNAILRKKLPTPPQMSYGLLTKIVVIITIFQDFFSLARSMWRLTSYWIFKPKYTVFFFPYKLILINLIVLIQYYSTTTSCTVRPKFKRHFFLSPPPKFLRNVRNHERTFALPPRVFIYIIFR